ncbi:FAD assembly factor SdhE [Roseivivax sediminis]|uniref:FAD assembly factor SdhE n=1 Tax=Roseivivax sediminis TaxID=936889 RepID=A0A1I2BLS4_9RHOB|nr:succinate dehydrogenase assembly factor 2 [Roseivivax sediminis]SFE56949.1 antitoxin CptB [Roseivivax sediminis]
MSAAEEPAEVRLKRLRMRSARRGTKEMDLILIRFSETELGALGPEDLDLYEDLLSENDQDLYAWISGQRPAPDRYGALVARIAGVMSQKV